MRRIKIFSVLLTLLVIQKMDAQTNSLTLEQCHSLSRQNFPLIRQKELIEQSKEYTVANVYSGNLPQVTLIAQATYQSDVTKVSIDNPAFPKITPLSKDQYKVYAEVNQNLYDGGAIKRSSALQEASAQVEDQKIEVELYKVKDRINQLYFGILLLDQQQAQIQLLQKDIQTSQAKVQASIENGVAFKMNADILEAELLKTEQRLIEVKSSRKAMVDMLGLFLNESLSESVVLQEPVAVEIQPSDDISRPELNLFNYQRQLVRGQYELTTTRTQPRAGLFLQAGYGKPGLNMLKNEFAPYAIGGLRLSWNLSGLYNSSREKQLLDVNTRSIDTQQELFMFNTKVSLRQTSADVAKLQELIRIDDRLIQLRIKIKSTAQAQLDNGVITANDFLRELNAEDQAKQNLLLHKTQLSMATYAYQNISGK